MRDSDDVEGVDDAEVRSLSDGGACSWRDAGPAFG
jgi:hypothetical protein